MQSGTIKKLVSDRGFGFIAAEDGKEYFFHRSGTDADFDRLQGGEKVTFQVEATPKGPRAAKFQVVAWSKTTAPRFGAAPPPRCSPNVSGSVASSAASRLG